MKVKIVFLLILSCIFGSCFSKKEPEFQRIKEVKLVEQSMGQIKFLIHLEFYNPNRIGGVFKSDDLLFYINSIELSTMETPLFEVPSKDYFLMPVYATIDKNSWNGNTLELASTIATIALSKQLDLSIKGNLKYTVLGHSSSYAIAYSEKIELIKN